MKVSPSTPSVSASCADAKPAAVERELAQHVLDRLLGDLPVALLAEHEPAVQVGDRELGVVVEHLLEVRHEPAPVDRIAVEAAADEVVHAAGGHRVERLLGHLVPSPPRSRNSTVGAAGNFGAPPQPPHSQSKLIVRLSSAVERI